MARKRIAFAMLEAGGGHKMPAIAVHESMKRLFPRKYDMQILDFMKDLGCVDLDELHKATWKYMLAHPNLTKSIQTFDFITGPVNLQLYKLAGAKPMYNCVERYLKKEKPDLIFSTHYFNTIAVSHVRKTRGFDLTLVNFLSEIFDFDSYWHVKNVDHYIVTSEQAERKLLRWRFPKTKIHLFPYPVRSSFFNVKKDRSQTLKSLGLDASRKTLLVSLGSEGLGAASLARMLAALLRHELPLNVVVVTGKNALLKRQLEVEFGGGTGSTRLLPLGFVERMNELMNAADFCFIKPGPATTWEALSLRKPILFATSAQLSESPNIRYVVKNQVGYYAGAIPRRFVQMVQRLMDDATLKEIAKNYRLLKLKNGADAIARFVDRLLASSP